MILGPTNILFNVFVKKDKVVFGNHNKPVFTNCLHIRSFKTRGYDYAIFFKNYIKGGGILFIISKFVLQ